MSTKNPSNLKNIKLVNIELRNPPYLCLISIHIKLQAIELSVEYVALYFKESKPLKQKWDLKPVLRNSYLNSKTVDNISFWCDIQKNLIRTALSFYTPIRVHYISIPLD